MNISGSILRSICTLIVGVLLVVWPEAAIVYLVIVIGILFLVPGLTSIIGYLMHRSSEVKVMFPLAAFGSTLFGLWLVIMPEFFVNILMYVLGAVLVLGGIQLIANLIAVRQQGRVPAGLYILPALILIAGILVLLNPFATATIPFIILGVSCIFYSISDLINYFRVC